MDDDGGVGLCCDDITSNNIPDFIKWREIHSKSVSRKAILTSIESNKVTNDIVVKSAKSGQILTRNITNLAEIESTRGGNGNKRGTPEWSHSRFQRQREGVYELGQYALSATIAAAKILETARKGKFKSFGMN